MAWLAAIFALLGLGFVIGLLWGGIRIFRGLTVKQRLVFLVLGVGLVSQHNDPNKWLIDWVLESFLGACYCALLWKGGCWIFRRVSGKP